MARAVRWLGVGFVVTTLSACASLLGLDPLETYEEGPEDEAGAPDAAISHDDGGDGSRDDGGDDGGDAGPIGGDGGSIGEVGELPCDPTEQPPASAVYVSAASSVDTPTGSPDAPYKAIGESFNHAKLDSAAAIVIDEGTYLENLTIDGFDARITLDGAWNWNQSDATWTRDCAPDRRTKTVLRSTADRGLTVANGGVPVQLSNLTIETRGDQTTPQGTSGASRYGVFVDRSLVKLIGVHVNALAGAPGGAARTGKDGTTRCTSCEKAPYDGVDGPPGAPAGTGAFGPGGYTPADGSPGAKSGTDGSNGTPGGNGESAKGCWKSCEVVKACSAVEAEVLSGMPGQCGCGGSGGAPGEAGRGGGASIAIFAVGTQSLVNVAFSELTAGNGGDGSPGGAGGAGGVPSSGAVGDAVRCYEARCCTIGNCTEDPPGCGCYGPPNWHQLCGSPQPSSRLLSGGSAGGKGRAGGKGSAGGGGSGGPSYVVATVGGAKITIENNSKRTFGNGGTGAGSAPNGSTGEKAP